MHLTLLVPELVWSDPDDRALYDPLDASGLARLLARTPPARGLEESAEQALAVRMGVAPTTAIAALRAAGDGLAAAAGWLCADPVHLRFHQERLILADESQIGLDDDEAQAIVASLNESFGDVGEFAAPAPGRWYLRPSVPPQQTYPALSQAVGREVALDALLGDRQLRRLGHETQMLLHNHPVNAARIESGRMAVNALWFWGGGEPPAAVPAAGRLFSRTAIGRGIGRLAGHETLPPPATLAELLGASSAPDAITVELDPLVPPAAYQDAGAWLDAWRSLDRDWFAPAARALRARRLRTLEIVSPGVFGTLSWRLSPASTWNFWSRATPLSQQIRRLIESDTR